MISIYKTNIEKNSQFDKISKELDQLVGCNKWNFDFEDCDKILRIDSDVDLSTIISKLFSDKGFICLELF